MPRILDYKPFMGILKIEGKEPGEPNVYWRPFDVYGHSFVYNEINNMVVFQLDEIRCVPNALEKLLK